MRGSKRRGCLPCDGAPALSNHPPQYVLNGSQSPVREGGQRGLACPLGGHLRGRRTGARTQGGGRGCQAGVGGASESDGGGKGGIQPLRIGILGTQDIRLSSAQQWPVRRWQGPLRGRKVAPGLYQGSLWHLTRPLLPPVGAAYRMEGRKRPKPSPWGPGVWLVFLIDGSKHLWGRVGTKSPLEEIPPCISGQDTGLGRTQESVFRKSPVSNIL